MGNSMIWRVIVAGAMAGTAGAQDWNSHGGNPMRNGRALVSGPQTAQLLWGTSNDASIISWAPFVSDGKVFAIRETGFPSTSGAGDEMVAWDVGSGDELWRITVPYAGDPTMEWIAWIAGAQDGRVIASRSQNLGPAPLRAFDADTGALLWTSAIETEAFAYDGAVFAPNGDLVVADRLRVARLDAATGGTVWESDRSCPVSGACGPALGQGAVYVDQAVPGGNAITRFDLATGLEQYTGPTMPGFTDQNTPFVSEDGTRVFFARSQNNGAVDFLYAFEDDGTQLIELWQRPVRWTTSHEFGLAADGSIYALLPGDEFVRLDPDSGSVLSSAGVLAPLGSPNASPKTAVGQDGTVYLSNGWASSPATNGRLWAFSPDLSQTYFTLVTDRPNQGGPVLAGCGVLVVADRDGVRAYAEPVGQLDALCATVPNSSGAAGALGATGSALAVDGRLQLCATQLPADEFAYFVTSQSTGSLPVGSGVLCLGSPQVRFRDDVLSTGVGGFAVFSPDFGALPLGADFSAGTTWWFQLWHRDGGTSNFTDSLGVTFQ